MDVLLSFFLTVQSVCSILSQFNFSISFDATFRQRCSICQRPVEALVNFSPADPEINNDCLTSNMASVLQPGPQVSRMARVFFLVFVLLFIVALSFGPTGPSSLAPENASWRLEKTSKTIEERVEHILKHTPLIGIKPLESQVPDLPEEVRLTSPRRRPQ
jgi:hypothetical protein